MEKKTNPVSVFFSKYFFYRTSKKEKKHIRQKIMEDDFLATKVVLILICLFQVIMLIRSLFNYGLVPDSSKPWITEYRFLYSFLGISCGIALIVSKEAYVRKQDFLYFSVVNTMMVILEIWAAGITILDSYNGIDLTVFAYVVMVIPIFLIVEPWIATINLSCTIILLNLHFLLHSAQKASYGSSVIVNSLSIFVLFVIACSFTFYRRIKKLNLEFEIVELNKQLEKKAIIDDLTGLYNRTYFSDVINKPLNVGFKPSGIMMIDIDHFKMINDIYGHASGDIVLKKLGTILSEFVNEKGYAIRYGGEEFLVYINRTNDDLLVDLADELRKKIEETIVDIGNGTEVKFTVSIGCSIASSKLSYNGLISLADKALYESKKERNKVSLAK